MYIEPNTVIRLLKNCPLDNTYDHTIYFDNSEKQYTYFAGLTKYALSRQTYQRVNQSRMRVQYKADDLYDCNYLMFQNTSFGNKWFYAFIKSVEYVNNITSEIVYEIDVMQTWAFDYQLGQCFVDREHSATDVFGENTVPESLEHGLYVTDSVENDGILYNTSIVVGCTFDSNYEDAKGSYIGGAYSGLVYHVFPNTQPGGNDCADFIANAGAKSEGIVCVFIMPTAMTAATGGNAVRKYFTKPKMLTLLRTDGKEVKNKKVLTYPYNFLYVSNNQGTHAEYHYELFSSDECEFTMTGDVTPSPSVIMWPSNYKGARENIDEKITLSGYPQCSFNVDTYRAWLAQNGGTVAVNALSAVWGGVTGVLNARSNAEMLTSVGNAGINIMRQLAEVEAHEKMPNQAKGASGTQALLASGQLQFTFMTKHIKPEFATIIDDYFTMFGYATHRTKIPNRNVRPHWTYTKTTGCVVHGSVPADDMKSICRIFDNGITFWKNGNEIGDYSLDNSV